MLHLTPALNKTSMIKPVKLVICVNTSLKMSAGKMAAQVGHASNVSTKSINLLKKSQPHLLWKAQGQPKIVVAAKDDSHIYELQKLCEEYKIPNKVVSDAGRTEIAAGTVTCFRIGPFYSQEIDRVSGKLKLLNTWPHVYKD